MVASTVWFTKENDMFVAKVYFKFPSGAEEREFEISSHAFNFASETAQQGLLVKEREGEWVYYPAHQISIVSVKKKDG